MGVVREWMEMACFWEVGYKDIFTMKRLKVTPNVGKTFKFSRVCKNGHFQNLFFKESTHNCRYSHETLCHERSWCPVVPVKISGKYLNPNRFYIKKCFLRIFTNLLKIFSMVKILGSFSDQNINISWHLFSKNINCKLAFISIILGYFVRHPSVYIRVLTFLAFPFVFKSSSEKYDHWGL